jgi:isoprenylcysteine carboxyl methyltransferase (ICMT) family protein YpbQ
MLNIFFPISFLIFAAFFLCLSKSQKNYQKLVKNNGEEFANKVNKYLKLGGYLLLLCSVIWLGFNLFEN